ncbi:MBL fold metallo-hydrolase [Sulfurimonas sp.]|uniref:MBL fold metallo-hydrolase n=1 Tax=Sulfurimonas sp. TaxID=2022749 RepID=UPI0035685D9E
MKLTFLGTSASKPTKERNVSALALEFDQDNKWYLFDCGEATQHQLLKSYLSVSKLNTIFITHLHGDHYYGLPGLLSSKTLDDSLSTLSIYGPLGIKKFLQCSVGISEEKLGYKLDIIEFKSGDEFKFDKFSLKVLPLVHSIESFAFYIKEDDITNKINEEKLRALGIKPSALYGELKRGKRVEFNSQILEPKEFMLKPVPGRRLIIAGDNSQPEILDDYLKELDLLVHECTYTQEVYDNLPVKFMHTTAKDLGSTAQKMRVKNLIANHINPRFNKNSDMDIDVVYNEIKQKYKGKLFIANDFDVYELNRNALIKKLKHKGSLSSSSAIILD